MELNRAYKWVFVEFGKDNRKDIYIIENSDTQLDELEGTNLKDIWRKLNIVARKITRSGEVEVEGGVFAYDTISDSTSSLHLPFSLFLSDGGLLVAEVTNKGKVKKWQKNKPTKVDKWILNGVDITEHITDENHIYKVAQDLIKAIKASKPPKKSDKLIEAEDKLIELMGQISHSLIPSKNKVKEVVDREDLGLEQLKAIDGEVEGLEERENLLPRSELDDLISSYKRALERVENG